MLDRFEARGVGHLLERHCRLSYEGSRARELHAPNCAVKRIPQLLFNPQLETRPRDGHRIDHVRYLDSLHGILLYETQCLRYQRIVDGQHVARLASYDPLGIDNEAAFGRFLPEHHLVERIGIGERGRDRHGVR